MNFLVEVDNNGMPINDMVYVICKQIPFILWWHNTKSTLIKSTIDNLNKIWINDPSHTCPVGTLDFVFKYLNKFIRNDFIIKPLNIPDQLKKYSEFNGIIPENIILNDLTRKDLENKYLNKRLFIKSSLTIKKDKIKRSIGLDKIKDGSYQVSAYRPIDSEYRCFIYKNILIGMRYYDGNMFNVPNKNIILSMINDFTNAPPAYVLDVSVDKDNKTRLVEVNDFFSVGLYGEDNISIPYMAYVSYRNIVNNFNRG